MRIVYIAKISDDQKKHYQMPTKTKFRWLPMRIEGVTPKMYKADITFMNGGAPNHTSKNALAYLDHKKACLLSDWPSKSTDLNPCIKYVVILFYLLH